MPKRFISGKTGTGYDPKTDIDYQRVQLGAVCIISGLDIEQIDTYSIDDILNAVEQTFPEAPFNLALNSEGISKYEFTRSFKPGAGSFSAKSSAHLIQITRRAWRNLTMAQFEDSHG